jgi:hypothetical protein
MLNKKLAIPTSRQAGGPTALPQVRVLPVQRFQSIRLGGCCHESKEVFATIKKDHLVDDPL